SSISDVEEILRDYEPGEEVEITYRWWNEEKMVRVTLAEDPSFKTEINSGADGIQREKRSAWLK
ncbi:MAG: peptidase M61, partial [Gracilimonas sp.]|nr:peptidase M61 [Gracilimonas sp.]